MADATGPMDLLNEALTGYAGAITAGTDALTGAFSSLIGAISQYVSALSPATMDMLNQSMRELNATIGQALIPIANVLSSVLREVATVISPLMQELAPVIAKVTNLLGDVAVAVTSVYAAFYEALLPIIDELTNALAPFAAVIQVAAAALAALFQAARPLVDFLLKVSIEPLVDAIKTAVKALILFAAQLAMAFGQKDFLDDVIRNLGPKQAQSGLAAPTGAGIKSLDSIAKDIQTGAFTAGGQGGGRTQDEYLTDIVENLKKIAGGDSDWKTVIAAALGEWWDKIKSQPPLSTLSKGADFVKNANDATGGWLGTAAKYSGVGGFVASKLF